jgi:putative redox protein
MHIHIRQVDDEVHFEARNERGNTAQIDGADVEAEGMQPMELLLASVATCSAIDLVQILKKQRQPLEDLQIEVDGKRPEDTTPRPFKAISLKFKLFGELEESKVARAVELSVEKYCSVAATLDRDVDITHQHIINPAE